MAPLKSAKSGVSPRRVSLASHFASHPRLSETARSSAPSRVTSHTPIKG
jgi:hypothetical protein